MRNIPNKLLAFALCAFLFCEGCETTTPNRGSPEHTFVQFTKRIRALGFQPFARPVTDIAAGTLMTIADGREILTVPLSEPATGRTNPVIRLPFSPGSEEFVLARDVGMVESFLNRPELATQADDIRHASEIRFELTGLFIETVYTANLLEAVNTPEIINTFWGHTRAKSLFAVNRVIGATSAEVYYSLGSDRVEAQAEVQGIKTSGSRNGTVKIAFAKPVLIGYNALELVEMDSSKPPAFSLNPTSMYDLENLIEDSKK
jgi:hypothetical protein